MFYLLLVAGLSFPFTDFHELFNFFRKFCVTPVVSHVFLQIFAREIGARLPKYVPICACPTFDRCVDDDGVAQHGAILQIIG